MKILTAENYYEPDEYMDVSAFKKLSHCEVDGLLPFGESSTAMLVGSYVDAWVEGTLDEFIAGHPELIAKRGKNTGNVKSVFVQAQEICDFIKNDKVFMQFMSGEKQTIMTGAIAGIPFKIKMDSYSPHIAVNDLKVMSTITNHSGEYYDFITKWGYDIQMACYQEIVFQNTGERLPCYICAVTKETPINSAIINIPQYVMDKTLYNVQTKLPHLYDVKMGKVAPVGCGKCPACIESRKTTPIISMENFVDFVG